MTPVFRAIVEKGRLVLKDPSGFGLWLGQFVGKEVDVVVKRHRKKRTSGQPDELSNQNGYLWAVVYPLSARDLGYSVDEMHEIFTEMFAPFVYRDVGNTKVAVKIRTSEMDTMQFAQYTDSIRMKMAEMNIIIPDPEQVV